MKLGKPLFMDEDATIGLGELEYQKSKVFRTRISLFNLEKAFKMIKALNNKYVDIVVIKDNTERSEMGTEGDIVVFGKSDEKKISGVMIAGCIINEDDKDEDK